MKDNKMVSIIIPARNEIYLEKTLDNIIENAEGEIEILVMLDGYRPDPEIPGKPQVRYFHFDEPVGHRKCLNIGVENAKGKYIMKIDAHCAVDKGFDVKLVADCEYDWTVVPRMYNLNIDTWKPKLFNNTTRAVKMGKLHDYMYVGFDGNKNLRTLYYSGRQNRIIHEREELIDETMSLVGASFFMHKDRYLELGGSDEANGGWGQQGVEIALKSWLSGGKLMVNKKTWFAHWFRGGGGPGFPYHITGRDIKKARNYSKDLWLNNKWPKQTKKLEWLVEKFNPPGWNNFYDYKKFNRSTYHTRFLNKKNPFPKWMGTEILKYPNDLFLYQELLFNNKPDFLVEVGTYKGGSALFFANVFDMIGKGCVISVDKDNLNPPEHPRIKYINGRATDKGILDKVKEIIGDKTVMVSLDGNHHRTHVKRQLRKYCNMVTQGQYLVVEDTVPHSKAESPGPKEAVEWFVKNNKKFKQENLGDRFYFSQNPEGWLRRIK